MSLIAQGNLPIRPNGRSVSKEVAAGTGNVRLPFCSSQGTLDI
jgi:hypothetical protein